MPLSYIDLLLTSTSLLVFTSSSLSSVRGCYMLQEIGQVNRQELVGHFANNTLRIPIIQPFLDLGRNYTNFVQSAWQNASRVMSSVLVQCQNNSIVGSSMVYHLPELNNTIARRLIGDILDFVLPCYRWAASQAGVSFEAAYVTLVQAFTEGAERFNGHMLRITRHLFLTHSIQYYKSIHLLWESPDMNLTLTILGYTQVACGGGQIDDSSGPMHLCDWTRLDLASNVASNICLYQFVREQNEESVLLTPVKGRRN